MYLTRLSAVILMATTGMVTAEETGSFRLSGRLDAGARYFSDDGLYLGQSEAGSYPFVSLSLEGGVDVGSGSLAFDFSGLYDEDNGRSYFNIAKLYYYQSFDNADFLIGFDTENWSVVESRSVVNVLNPRNLSDSILTDAQLGTPMVTGNYYTDIGTFSGHVLLGFIEPNYGDERSRFRAPIIPDYDNPVFEEGSGKNIDFALRYTTNFNIGDGAADFSINYFNGTSRSAVCTTDGVTPSNCIGILASIPGGPGSGASEEELWAWLEANATDTLMTTASTFTVPELRPLYQHIQQVGTTFVYARNDLQLRFEGVYRESNGHDQVSAVVGGDYTFNDVTSDGASLTLALEYLYDDRDPEMGFSIFEDDVFVGAAYRWNNHLDTRMDFGVIHDLSSQANLFTLGFYSRLNDRLGVSLNATMVDVNGWNDPLSFAKNDSFVEFYLSTFF